MRFVYARAGILAGVLVIGACALLVDVAEAVEADGGRANTSKRYASCDEQPCGDLCGGLIHLGSCVESSPQKEGGARNSTKGCVKELHPNNCANDASSSSSSSSSSNSSISPRCVCMCVCVCVYLCVCVPLP